MIYWELSASVLSVYIPRIPPCMIIVVNAIARGAYRSLSIPVKIPVIWIYADGGKRFNSFLAGYERHHIYDCCLITRNEMNIPNILNDIWEHEDIYKRFLKLKETEYL